ncbi:unnamed protein product [Macrosiphum euphorbiae]|uniref:Uncharacterized protein n=1 Tax=Macrosiphum euphorbiae TaxID=13131 RepID=A0AAV0Y3S2_9HEMI|nr:unnamed protein product [Macrosiphum euphorbiae]
MQLEHFNLF